MKVNNWSKKLSAALVAAGLLAPGMVHAASQGVNLVVNGDFENVDLNITGDYGGPLVLNWTGPNLFAYSHKASSSSAGVVPDYADGADPPGAGNWYFTPNNTGLAAPTDVRDPGVYYQDINLATGPTAIDIAAGSAVYELSAYMSSYLNDADFGNVQVEFRNSISQVLASVVISDTGDAGPDNEWSLVSTSGVVPVGTASVRVSLYGTTADFGRGGDGYIDNVVFLVRGIPEPSSVLLAGLSLAGVGAIRLQRRKP